MLGPDFLLPDPSWACRIPCRFYIYLVFTYSVGPSSVVWSELGPAPPFPPMRVLEVQWSRALSLVCEVALGALFWVQSRWATCVDLIFIWWGVSEGWGHWKICPKARHNTLDFEELQERSEDPKLLDDKLVERYSKLDGMVDDSILGREIFSLVD